MKLFFFLSVFLPFHLASAQSTCEPVSTDLQKTSDCRYSQQDWARPTHAEWSRDIRGVRSGIINIYVHAELSDLRSTLVEAGWNESLAKNKADNKAYATAVTDFEVYRLKVHELREMQTAVESGKTCRSRGIVSCESPEKIAQSEVEIEAKLLQLGMVVQAMPVSDEFVCSQIEKTAFEQENDPFGGRHHLRIFETGSRDAQGISVWGVVANRDTGIVLDKNRANQAFFNHAIEANADNERDKVLVDLMKTKRVKTIEFSPVQFSCDPPLDKAKSFDKMIVELEITPLKK